jgi:integrase
VGQAALRCDVRGLVCGLTWSDVDLDRRIITVRRSYAGQTKSGRHREVPIPSVLVDVLRLHRREEPYQGELCFPNDAGEMYTKNGKLEDVLRAALTKVGLPRIRLHDLRHVYGAHFVMAGGASTTCSATSATTRLRSRRRSTGTSRRITG